MPTKPKLPKTLEGKVRRWLRVRLLLSQAEAAKRELQPYIEKMLERAPDHVREFFGRELAMTTVTQRRLNEAALRKAYGDDEIDRFLSESSYNRINVK